MEFTCSRQAFHDALSLVSSLIPSRSSKPILQNVCFSSEGKNALLLTATDLEIGVRYLLEVESLSQPESFALPATRLRGVIHEAWGDSISVRIKDAKAEIETEGGKFRMQGESAEEFPLVPEFPGESAVEMEAEGLIEAIQRTIFATAREEERYALAGVHISIEKKTVEFVTTDTFRLALCRKGLRKSSTRAMKAIVPVKAMQELSKLLQGEELVSLAISDTQFFAQTKRATLVSRLIEGKFPQYENVIPKELGKKVTVNRERFMQALRQAAQLSNEETRAVNLVTLDGAVTLQSTAADGSQAQVQIEAVTEGGEVAVSFNYIYLLDACKVLGDESVTLQLRDRDAPGRIDSQDYTYVVSPVCPRTGA